MNDTLGKLIGGVKSIGFFGLGRSNISLLKMLPREIPVTLRSDVAIDRGAIPRGIRVLRIFEGERALCEIDEELLILSPSVRRDRPELASAAERGVILSSDAELFFNAVNAPVLAVSGSSGKSTVATLAAMLINGKQGGKLLCRDDDHIERDERIVDTCHGGDNDRGKSGNGSSGGKKSGEGRTDNGKLEPTRCAADNDCSSSEVSAHARAVLCGNVGAPMLEAIDSNAELYVAELSSFMLASHRATVKRAAITNITPNHLDWHSSFDEYKATKLSLLSLSEQVIISADDPELSAYVGRTRRIFGVFSTRLTLSELLRRHKAKIYMTLEDGFICRNGERIIDTGRLIRREDYNIANMMCALLLSDGYADNRMAEDILYGFFGLAHRARTIGTACGVDLIDSSIDTTPERAAATLNGLARKVILLLGGRAKGLSYAPLIESAKRWARLIFTFGEENNNIAEALSGAVPCVVCKDLAEAVSMGFSAARSGEALLLSPACTSFDAYSSFEERGEHFVLLTKELRGTDEIRERM